MQTHEGQKVSKNTKNTKKYQCDICFKELTGSYNLSVHMMTHRGEKPFECQSCGMNFTRKYDMLRHVKKIHENIRPVKEKPHQCEYCEKAFENMYQLTRHLRSHTNEKPYR